MSRKCTKVGFNWREKLRRRKKVAMRNPSLSSLIPKPFRIIVLLRDNIFDISHEETKKPERAIQVLLHLPDKCLIIVFQISMTHLSII